MRSSLASRLKAFSPPQLALVALGSLALAGVGMAASAGLIGSVGGPSGGLTGGDQDLADGTPTFGTLTRYRVVTKQPKKPQDARATTDGPAELARSGSEPAKPAAADGTTSAPAQTPAPVGGGQPTGGGGPSGDTGGAGPQGDTGGAGPKRGSGGSGDAGPKGDTGSGGATGGAGPAGDTGSGGPTTPKDASGAPAPAAPPAAPGAPPAPAVFVVKDAAGTTAGTLVGSDPSAAWLTFLYKQRAFLANARTGELDLPTVDTSYATDNCTGTPYATLSRPATSVLRTANPNETGIYEYGAPITLEVRSIWQPGEDGAPDKCLQYPYTNSEIAPLRELPASERPPALTGPLKAVRAS